MRMIEERLSVPLKGEYDIVVCGGGVAGIAAAVAARRAGIDKVLLLEKSFSLGGLATSGLIMLFEPLDDGTGDRVMDGLALEFFENSIKYGMNTLDPAWKSFPKKGPVNPRCMSVFSPTIFSLVLDDMLRKEDIDLVLDSHVVSSMTEGNICKAVVVENREGRVAYGAKMFIDATGDAILLDRCGVPCKTGKNWLASICLKASVENAQTAANAKSIFNLFRWHNYGANDFGIGHPEGFPMLEGLSSEEVTFFTRSARNLVFNAIKDEEPQSRDLTALPSIPQLRKTRRIDGDFTITDSDANVRHADSIGVCGDYKYRGKWYEVSLGSTFNRRFPNLITCGRSISADGWAWDALREIPVCIMTGQAAGAVASEAVMEGKNLGEVAVEKIQTLLEKQGVRLHK